MTNYEEQGYDSYLNSRTSLFNTRGEPNESINDLAGGVETSEIKVEEVLNSPAEKTFKARTLSFELRGWTHDMTFSATDYNTLAWTSGTLTLGDGTQFSIASGNVDMSTLTYIYFDLYASASTLQTTTTVTNAIGQGKILIAVGQDNADTEKDCTYQVFGGSGGIGTFITADQIAANTITANEIDANTITANELNVSQLSAITADMGDLTAGTITLDSGGDIKSGATDYMTGIGWWLGYSSGAKFHIGNPSGQHARWDGTSYIVVGNNVGLYKGVAGQSMTAGDPVFMAPNSTTEFDLLKYFNNGTASGSPGYETIEKNNEIFAQSFVIPGSGTVKVWKVRLKVGSNNTPGNWKVSIQSDDGGQPDEVDLVASATLTSGDANPNSPNWTYISFSSTYALTCGTTYWLVVTSLESDDASNYYLVYYQFPNAYSGQSWAKKNWDTTWTTNNNLSMLFELYGQTTNTRIYKADARNASTTDTFLGFLFEDANSAGNALIQNTGIYDGLTSLTPGTVYYLADGDFTNGGWPSIGTAAGTVSKVVGRTLDTNSINVKSNNE